MRRAMKYVKRLFSGEIGATAVEYAIMLALIAAVIIFAVEQVGLAAYQSLWDVVEAL